MKLVCYGLNDRICVSYMFLSFLGMILNQSNKVYEESLVPHELLHRTSTFLAQPVILQRANFKLYNMETEG